MVSATDVGETEVFCLFKEGICSNTRIHFPMSKKLCLDTNIGFDSLGKQISGIVCNHLLQFKCKIENEIKRAEIAIAEGANNNDSDSNET